MSSDEVVSKVRILHASKHLLGVLEESALYLLSRHGRRNRLLWILIWLSTPSRIFKVPVKHLELGTLDRLLRWLLRNLLHCVNGIFARGRRHDARLLEPSLIKIFNRWGARYLLVKITALFLSLSMNIAINWAHLRRMMLIWSEIVVLLLSTRIQVCIRIDPKRLGPHNLAIYAFLFCFFFRRRCWILEVFDQLLVGRRLRHIESLALLFLPWGHLVLLWMEGWSDQTTTIIIDMCVHN